MFVSVTRLRIRHWWDLPAFYWWTYLSTRQVQSAAGFRGGFVLVDKHRAFWTMTGWESEAAMKAYRGSGAHREAMKKLPARCDEASVARWEAAGFSTWMDVWQRMQSSGRFTPVDKPSPAQLEKRIAEPRTKPLIQRAI